MTTVRLPTDRLVSLADLIAATSAAVEADDREYKVVDRLNPRAVGKFSPRRQVADVHSMELAELIRSGAVTARSLFSRAPLAIPVYEDWKDTITRYGFTFDDARVFCELLALELVPETPEIQSANVSKPEQSNEADEMAESYLLAMRKTQREKRFSTAKELFQYLAKSSDELNSCFEKGTAHHLGKLIHRESRIAISLKTVQNQWGQIKTL